MSTIYPTSFYQDSQYDAAYAVSHAIRLDVQSADSIEEQRVIVRDWLTELDESADRYTALALIRESGCADLLPLHLQ